MGSYKDSKDYLPFLTAADREAELALADKVFRGLAKKNSRRHRTPRSPTIPRVHAHGQRHQDSRKINSRPGDPEIINLLPVIKDDFADVCLQMIDGNLKGVEMEKSATVLTYRVPPDYGGYSEVHANKLDKSAVGGPVDYPKPKHYPRSMATKSEFTPEVWN